jgi:hypothetical protein
MYPLAGTKQNGNASLTRKLDQLIHIANQRGLALL